MPKHFHGRRVLYASCDPEDLTKEKIKEILNEVFPIHLKNRAEMCFLERYYRGVQPILDKKKEVRPNINNIAVENFAFMMVEFKKAYEFGKPIRYVQVGETTNQEISLLNKLMTHDSKHEKDVELSESLFVNGIGHKITLPSKNKDYPFETNTLDSKNTFVVYSRNIGNKPLFGVTYYAYKENQIWKYKGYLYTAKEYYEFEYCGTFISNINDPETHILGAVPIVEYRLNKSRMGIVEVAMSMCDILNKIASSDMDGIEQFIQSLVVFVNNDVDAETFKELMALGAVKVKSENPSFPADVKLLVNNLDHNQTDVYYNRTLSNMLSIVGMPIPTTKTSGGDTGEARQLGDGWTMADLRADNDELMFKSGEMKTLEIQLNICKTSPTCPINSLTPEDIDIKFERNKSDNLLVKTQALQTLMSAGTAPRPAYSVVGLWSDPMEVVEESEKYQEEKTKKQQEIFQNQNVNQSNNSEVNSESE